MQHQTYYAGVNTHSGYCTYSETAENISKDVITVADKIMKEAAPYIPEDERTSTRNFLTCEIDYYINDCITGDTDALFIHLPSLFSLRSDENMLARLREFAFTAFQRNCKGLEFLVMTHEDDYVYMDLMDASIMTIKFMPRFHAMCNRVLEQEEDSEE